MSNPNEPIEIFVTDLHHLCFDHGFIEGEIHGTYARLCISIHALQTLFEYACREGVFVVHNDVYYKKGGQIRRYKRAENKANAIEENLGTSEEPS